MLDHTLTPLDNTCLLLTIPDHPWQYLPLANTWQHPTTSDKNRGYRHAKWEKHRRNDGSECPARRL